MGFIGPIVSAFAAPYVADMRRNRAFRRLLGEILYEPGNHVDVFTSNHSDPVCPDATIESIEVGRVVFRHHANGHVYLTPFTGAEVENLIVRVRIS